jgi:HlyD family secretion protein
MDKQIQKKRFTPKKIALYSGIALFVLFVLYVFVFSDQSRKFNQDKDRLSISTVSRGKFQDYIPITGEVEPIKTFFLDVTDGGKVVQKYVEEGAVLKAGDPIIKIDNPNLSLQLMNTQSSFIYAESQLRQNRLTFEQNKLSKQNQMLDINRNLLVQKRTFENSKALYEKNLISKNEYETAKETYEYYIKSKELTLAVLKNDSLTNIQMLETAQATLKKNQEYLKLVENQLASLTVRAPISGQLTSLKAEIGQNIGGGYRLGQIDNSESYKIKADIDEHYISRVKAGQTGVYEFDGKNYSLTIKTVYPQVANGKFQVEMYFVGGEPKGIRRGQTVHIKLDLGGESDAVLVEAGGFFQTTGGQYIFVVDQSGKYAVRRAIKIGRQNPQFYEVLSGLNPGEKVITSSYENFGEAEKIILN